MPKNQPGIGSWDPFEDIADQLDALGEPYVLSVGKRPTILTKVFSNVRSWGMPGVRNMRKAIHLHLQGVERKALEDEESENQS